MNGATKAIDTVKPKGVDVGVIVSWTRRDEVLRGPPGTAVSIARRTISPD